MKKLTAALITLTAIGVAVRVVGKKYNRITKGTISGNEFRVINSNHKNLF